MNKFISWLIIIVLITPAYGLNIPESYGNIVIIKDTHCNYEVSRNIVDILRELYNEYSIDLIGIEGAGGILDASIFIEDDIDAEIRKEVADIYLRHGWLSPAEVFAIEEGIDYRFKIYGVEDRRLYLENVKGYREVYNNSSPIKSFIEEGNRLLDRFKAILYAGELYEFDKEVTAYRARRNGFEKFLKYLFRKNGNRKVMGVNLRYAIKAILLEEDIDPKKVEKERLRLIEELSGRLALEELEEILTKGILSKMDKIPSTAFYGLLVSYVPKERIGIYKELYRYNRLLRLHRKIDRDKVFGEIDSIIGEIYSLKIDNPITERVYKIGESVRILEKFSSLELRRDEISAVEWRSEIYSIAENLVELANILGQTIPALLEAPKFLSEAETSLEQPVRFYGYVLERDKIMARNLLRYMEETGRKNAVVIAGGFHVDELARLVREEGFNPIIVRPNITRDDKRAKAIYLKRILDTGFNPEKLLLEHAQDKLAPPVVSGWGRFDRVVAGIRGKAGKKAKIGWLPVPGNSGCYGDLEVATGISFRMDIVAGGKRVTARIDGRLRMIQDTLGNVLDKAIQRAQIMGLEINIPAEITLELLSKSTHLAENHIGDGYIGINRYVLDKVLPWIRRKHGNEKAMEFLAILIEHELMHEITGEGNEIENRLIIQDIARMIQIFGIGWVDSFAECIPDIRSLLDGWGLKEELLRGLGIFIQRGYAIEDYLGKGGYSFAFLVKDPKGNTRVLKLTPMSDEFRYFAKNYNDFLREFFRKKDLPEEIVRVMEVGHAGDALGYEIQEFKGRFNNSLKEGVNMSIDKQMNFMLRLLSIMKYLQDNGIRHGDVKENNVLVDDDGRLRLIDFGTSYWIDGQMELVAELSPEGDRRLRQVRRSRRGERPVVPADMQETARLLIRILAGYVNKGSFSVNPETWRADIKAKQNVLREELIDTIVEQLHSLYKGESSFGGCRDNILAGYSEVSRQLRKAAAGGDEFDIEVIFDLTGGRLEIKEGSFLDRETGDNLADRWPVLYERLTKDKRFKEWLKERSHDLRKVGFAMLHGPYAVLRGDTIIIDRYFMDYPIAVLVKVFHEIAHMRLQEYYLTHNRSRDKEIEQALEEAMALLLEAEFLLSLDERLFDEYVDAIVTFWGFLYEKVQVGAQKEGRLRNINRYKKHLKEIHTLRKETDEEVKRTQLLIYVYNYLKNSKKYMVGILNARKARGGISGLIDYLSGILRDVEKELLPSTLKAPRSMGLDGRPVIEGKTEIAYTRDKIIIRTVELGTQLGMPRIEGANRPQELVYAYGEREGDNLCIYVTKAFWDVLQEDPLMLEFLLDHEWQEQMEGKSHAEVSQGAWQFVDETGMNPFYRFYLYQLAEKGELKELSMFTNTPHVNDKENRVRNYARMLLLINEDIDGIWQDVRISPGASAVIVDYGDLARIPLGEVLNRLRGTENRIIVRAGAGQEIEEGENITVVRSDAEEEDALRGINPDNRVWLKKNPGAIDTQRKLVELVDEPAIHMYLAFAFLYARMGDTEAREFVTSRNGTITGRYVKIRFILREELKALHEALTRAEEKL